MCTGAVSGASAAGTCRVAPLDAESVLPGDGPPVVACAATDWRTLAASAGSGVVRGAGRDGTPFAGRPANMASMDGRSAAPNGVARKSLGSAVGPHSVSRRRRWEAGACSQVMYEGRLPPVRNPIQSLVNELQLKSGVNPRISSCCTLEKRGSLTEQVVLSTRVGQRQSIQRWFGIRAHLVCGVVFAHGSNVLVERVFVYSSLPHV